MVSYLTFYLTIPADILYVILADALSDDTG